MKQITYYAFEKIINNYSVFIEYASSHELEGNNLLLKKIFMGILNSPITYTINM